jgi:hypothetical protein
MATVNPDDPVFRAEEEHWFDDLAKHPIEAYTLKAQVLTADAEGALARLVTTARLQGSDQPARPIYTARFRPIEGRWVLAGPEWKTAQGEHFVVKYVDASAAAVQAALDAGEKAYAQVTADLNYLPASQTEVKLYDDVGVMHASILLSLPTWANGWYEPGEAIKLSPRVAPSAFSAYVAHEFTHRALFDLGVSTAWFQEGVAVFESLRTAPERATNVQSRYVPAVREAQRTEKLFDWADMPGWDLVSDQEATLFYAQSWMLVDEFARQFGMERLNRLIRGIGGGQDFQQAFASAAGMPFEEWEPGWQESVRLAGVPAEWIRGAQGFDPAKAMEAVRLLALPEYAGRKAGSPGAEAAARWIAEKMEAYDLQPGAPDGTFFQSVTVSYSELTAMAELTLKNTQTGESIALAYREKFREALGGRAGGGEVDSDLVWLQGGFPEGANLGGRVALKFQQGSVVQEAKQAYNYGAGGLVLVVKDPYMNMRERATFAAAPEAQTLPVAQITEETWRGLLKLAGLTTYQANNAPPALVMSLKARLSVPYEPPRSAVALNVVGYLPGARPDARPLVIAAYYDGLGSLPDGTLFPGANKNASGVAVMLEVARALQAAGYRPARPIYFIAWGAEETGLASAHFYAGAPAVPLGQMLGLLELDTVGAARSYYLNLEGDKDGGESELLFALRLAADLLDRRVSPEGYKGGNTHEVFRTRGVPSVLLFWPNADDLHTPQDTPDTLDPYKLATTGEVVALAAMMMGR